MPLKKQWPNSSQQFTRDDQLLDIWRAIGAAFINFVKVTHDTGPRGGGTEVVGLHSCLSHPG